MHASLKSSYISHLDVQPQVVHLLRLPPAAAPLAPGPLTTLCSLMINVYVDTPSAVNAMFVSSEDATGGAALRFVDDLLEELVPAMMFTRCHKQELACVYVCI